MNKRISTVIAAVMLLSLSSGCSGMRNFLFGRGASCGLCSRIGSVLPTPSFGNTMQAPTPTCPSAPCGSAPIASPGGCGCNSYAGPGYVGDAYSSACGCGNAYPYASGSSDPYGGLPIDGSISGTPIYPNAGYAAPIVPGAPGMGTPGMGTPMIGSGIPSDGFSQRQVDGQGNRILSVDPLPPGARVQ